MSNKFVWEDDDIIFIPDNRYMSTETVTGDITKLKEDAIVNAAATSLSGGGGVDGAIHAAAGPQLAEECGVLGGCGYGEAKLTEGYNLPAKYIIHTVGPIYGNHNGKEPEILYSCYYSSLKLADEHNIKTIAFPEIATGVYHYPKEQAREVANKAITDYFKNNPESGIEQVSLVIFRA